MRRRRRRLLVIVALTALSAVVAFAGWVAYLDHVVTREFRGRLWSVPARVYAEPLEVYVGAPVSGDDLEQELRRLHYRPGDPAAGPGLYRRHGAEIELSARRVRFVDELRAPARVTVRTSAEAVTALAGADGGALPLFRLDPLLVGDGAKYPSGLRENQ